MGLSASGLTVSCGEVTDDLNLDKNKKHSIRLWWIVSWSALIWRDA